MDKGELGLPGPIVHDWIYRHGGVLPTHSLRARHVYTRAEADRLFLQLMEQDGVKRHRRWLAYVAVRVGGGLAWTKVDTAVVA